MQVIFHGGAHSSSEELLFNCLLRNKDAMSARGSAIPAQGRYRNLLKNACKALDHSEPAPNARDILLDAILEEENADRVVLSHPNLFCIPTYALNKGQIYPLAGQRVANLCRLFNLDQIELFLAIRNPATFLPATLRDAPRDILHNALQETDLYDLRWSDMIENIRIMAPDVPVTVWCYEDSPLIWAQLIREIGGFEHGEKIVGGFALLSTIMSREGMYQFRSFLHKNRNLSELQKRQVIMAFLDKFALKNEIEVELDLPGWTDELVADMTELYEEDIFAIQRLPGVQMIAP